MLWIAGLMGLMSVGTVTMVDGNRTVDDTPDDASEHDDQATLLLAEQMRADLAFLDPMPPSERGMAETAQLDRAQAHGPDAAAPDIAHPQTHGIDGAPSAPPSVDDGQDSVVAAAPETVPDWSIFEDFDPEEDGILVVWDDSAGDAPEFDLTPSDTDAGMTELRAGEHIIAQVPTGSGFGPEHVVIIPQSAAALFDWADI